MSVATAELMDHGEVLKLLRASRHAVYQWRKAGAFPKPLGIGRNLKWRRVDVVAFIEKKAQQAAGA